MPVANYAYINCLRSLVSGKFEGGTDPECELRREVRNTGRQECFRVADNTPTGRLCGHKRYRDVSTATLLGNRTAG
jgi:hypothetical protein